VEDLIRLVVFAVHVEQDAAPDFALLKAFVEAINPRRLYQEEIQAGPGAITLDGVDE
jgi:hypothetical protein